MGFLAGVCLFIAIGGVAFLKQNWREVETKTRAIVIVIVIALFIGFIASLMGYMSDLLSSPRDRNNYSSEDLEWANEAKDFIDHNKQYYR